MLWISFLSFSTLFNRQSTEIAGADRERGRLAAKGRRLDSTRAGRSQSSGMWSPAQHTEPNQCPAFCGFLTCASSSCRDLREFLRFLLDPVKWKSLWASISVVCELRRAGDWCCEERSLDVFTFFGFPGAPFPLLSYSDTGVWVLPFTLKPSLDSGQRAPLYSLRWGWVGSWAPGTLFFGSYQSGRPPAVRYVFPPSFSGTIKYISSDKDTYTYTDTCT